jgi:paraquat-inducible protein B
MRRRKPKTMSEPDENTAPARLPRAEVKRNRRTWWLWLIPIGAVGLCAWFLFRDYVATGPLITIQFDNADGLEANNTEVRYRGAKIGEVKTIALSGDNQAVRVQARLASSASQLARAGSVFWIVRPEVKLAGVTGLRTIISGEYITVRPGNGPRTNSFAGAPKEPQAEEPRALRIRLLSPEVASVKEQSPIFFRGVQVGEVTEIRLDDDARDVVMEARIHEKYTPLVRQNSVFWNAGGINFSFGLLHGAQLTAESASTLLTGGIEFATPPDMQEPAANGAVFRLYEKADDKWKSWTTPVPLGPSGNMTNTTDYSGMK